MWMVKGVLLGVLVFVVGVITYIGIRTAIIFHQLAQQAKAETRPQSYGTYDIRIFLHDPILWGLLLAAIAVGLWFVRSRIAH